MAKNIFPSSPPSLDKRMIAANISIKYYISRLTLPAQENYIIFMIIQFLNVELFTASLLDGCREVFN